MACPHSLIGDPSSCSMCRGAVPRRVVRDPDTNVLTIDGKPAMRAFQMKSSPSPVRMATRGKRRAAARDISPMVDEEIVDTSDGASAD